MCCFHRVCTLVFGALVQRFGMCDILGIYFVLHMGDSVLINLDKNMDYDIRDYESLSARFGKLYYCKNI